MNITKVVITLSIITLLILPTVGAVIVTDQNQDVSSADFGFSYELYRTPYANENEEEAEAVVDGNWWERSAMDENRNGIFDSLENRIDPAMNIVLDYEETPTEEDLENLAELGLVPVKTYPVFNAAVINDVPATMLTTLTELPNVVMVEPRGTPIEYGDVQTPNCKARESEEYSPNTAWELGYSGNGVTVAIMDTGIDNAHPSFTGKWLGGVDFTKPDFFLTPRDGTYDADDTNGHGTTCAGIATGTGAPEGIYMGAAPDAKLVDIRIGSTIGYAPGELLQNFYDAALEGAEWAIQHKDDKWQGAPEENHGIHILSLSWGVDTDGSSDGSDVYSRALDETVKAGIFTIAAAGNSGPDNDGFRGMGSGSLVITVGATDDDDTIDRSDDFIAEYSSRGPRKDNNDGYPIDELKPDVAAPGTHIVQAQYDRTGDASNNGYGNRGSGTSYATPNVVGVVALMLEANGDLDQKLIKEILRFTAERRDEATFPDIDPFWNKDFGWGIIDAYSAVKVAEELDDVTAIDIELQCYITEVVDSNADPDRATAEFTGLAWGRVDSVDTVEVRWDDETKWRSIKDLEEVEAGSFINWTYKLDLRGMSKGNHTLYARTVGPDGSHSLIFSQEFTVIDPPPLKESRAIGAGVFAAVILFIVVAVVALMYFKKRKQ